ncbi:MAG: hypothetical protein AABZ53_08315 [Planctomycetota bacterium]
MPTTRSIEPRHPPPGGVARFVARLFTLVIIVLPLLVVLYDSSRGLLAGSDAQSPAIPWVSPISLAKTVLWAGVIGSLAAAFGAPLAWCCRPSRSRWRWALTLPMFVPSTLAYVGWGSLRAPLTPFAEWMAARVEAGWIWLPSAFDGTLAVVGLGLWAAPLAALVQVAWLRGVDDDTLEALRLDCGPVRRKVELARLSRASLLSSAAIVGVLMIGSAVPLHLAQVPTAGVNLWAAMDVMPSQEHWRVWIAAWPLVLLAGAAAIAASRWVRADRAGGSASVRCESSASILSRILVVLILAAGVGAPIVLAARGIRAPGEHPTWSKLGHEVVSAMDTWWRLNHHAVLASCAEALVVALLTVVVGMAAWCGMACLLRPRSRGALGAFAFVGAAVLPGVMVGSAVARLWNLTVIPAEWGETMGPLIAAHSARFGFVALLTAIIAATAEPPTLGDSRLLDGADTPRGWFHACVPGWGPVWLIVGSLVAALSVQDIEAAVIVQPPGVPSLARKLLSDMHFFRTQELGVGMLVSVSIGLAFAAAGAVLWAGLRILRGRAG